MADSLSASFRSFYNEVLRLRRQVSAGTAGADLAAGRRPLREAISALDGNVASGEADAVDDARLLMAAFADEIFTGLEGPFAEAWRANPLAVELFQAPEASSEVIARIEQLVQSPRPDGVRPRLYLTALNLDFGAAGERADEVRALRARLIETAYPGTAGAEGPIFPQAYVRTTGEGAGEPLPSLKGWWLVAITGVLVVLLISWPLWRSATEPVAELVTRILGA